MLIVDDYKGESLDGEKACSKNLSRQPDVA